jgi:imidazolonepropionase-like amidohydrolase
VTALGSTVITNVHVFDGTSLTETRDVALDRGLIVASAPADATVVEGQGGTLIPGLIETHAHVDAGPALDEFARYGVTTVLDMGSQRPSVIAALRDAEGRPEILTAAAPATAPGSVHVTKMGYPASSAVADASAARQFVADQQAQGAAYIKIVLEDAKQPGAKPLPRETVAAIVAAAHAKGLLVVAHAVAATSYRLACDAGVDVLTHVPLAQGLTADDAARVQNAGIVVSPTLVMMALVVESVTGDPKYRFARRLRLAPALNIDNAVAAVRLLHGAGATILAGTDANADPHAPGNPPYGVSLHDELARLVGAGLTPVEALQGATSTAARVFRLADRGRIAAGLRADVVLLAGDPTTDITATRAIRDVWIGGRRL